MKKLLVGLIAAVVCAVCVNAGEDTSGLGYVTVAAPGLYTNNLMYNIQATSETNTCDLSGYKGIAELVITKTADLTAVAITNGTIALQSSAAAIGPYTDVSGVSQAITTGANVYHLQVPLDTCKRYPRIRVTLLGTNTVQEYVSAVLVLPRKSE